MDNNLKCILNFIQDERNLDFSGYRASMIMRRIANRLADVKCGSHVEYLLYLKKHPVELDNLINALTINVSRFFRDTLTFEYLAEKIIPAVMYQKKEAMERSLRIWSAGCAMGEEPYSIAILINEYLKKETLKLNLNIFATDIDDRILQKAQKGVYPFEGIGNIKYGLLKKYFVTKKNLFQLIPEIRQTVLFSVYDILDTKSYAPPESIFGCFDMVFCRNVLIYFDTEHQDLIFGKLYRSLSTHGYLVLGEAEIPSVSYQGNFRRVSECCHIYQKR